MNNEVKAKKKILVAVADYPNNDGGVALMYVHVRNKYYMKHDIDVTVLNFASSKDYEIDDIKVIGLSSYECFRGSYDTLVSHAANLRNHYRFLKKYSDDFKKLVFFYHGHEVVKLNDVYPEPYDYVKKTSIVQKIAQNIYDGFKLLVWHNYLPKIAGKSEFIFVSNWLFSEFKKYVKLDENDLKGHVHIIHNSVGEIFEQESYNFTGKKKYDFITIRSYMDGSKYGIDLVDQLARKYEEYSFLIIGRGDFYNVHDVPGNVTWIDQSMSHMEIRQYIDQSRCGLLLTREDTQGVMTCEMAVYGIPVITSDIDVCHEIFGDLKNVALIDNDIEKVDFPAVYKSLVELGEISKSTKFNYSNTVLQEENIIRGGYDFITIRSYMDSSTYCVDLICKIAENNPDYSFLLIGKGSYFEYNDKPKNITWINSYLSHQEMLSYIDHSRCALMPTRRDTQGVMSCELVTYGIPLITSDLPVCHEIFDGNQQVLMISNDKLEQIDLTEVLDKLTEGGDAISVKPTRYLASNTLEKEVALLLQ